MIDFETMHWSLKCVAIPLTVYSTLFILMYVGKFFCLGIAEKAFKVVDDEGESIHTLFIVNILMTCLWWGSWLFEIDIGVFLCTIFGAIMVVFCTVVLWLFLTYNGNPLFDFFLNMHRKIHERKHGKPE